MGVGHVMRIEREKRGDLLGRDGDFYFPLIRAKRVTKGCPRCGREKGLLYISTQKQDLFGPRDLVTWGCGDCGEIFAREDPNERGGDDETIGDETAR